MTNDLLTSDAGTIFIIPNVIDADTTRSSDGIEISYHYSAASNYEAHLIGNSNCDSNQLPLVSG